MKVEIPIRWATILTTAAIACGGNKDAHPVVTPDPIHTPPISSHLQTPDALLYPNRLSQAPTPEISPTPTNIQIIKDEARREGIIFSQNEVDRWNKTYTLPDKKIPLDQKGIEKAKQNLLSILDAMHNSENPYFGDAHSTISSSLSDSSLQLQFKTNLKNGVMSLGSVERSNKVGYTLTIDPNQILNQLDPINTALLLTDQAKLLQLLKEFQKKLPQDMSTQEQLNAITDHFTNPYYILPVRAQITATQAKALITDVGLTIDSSTNNVTDRYRENLVTAATVLIQVNGNINSQDWTNFVGGRIRGLERYQQ